MTTQRYNIIFYLTLVSATILVQAKCTAADVGKIPDRERRLIEVLQSNASPQEKAITCKQLAICGTKDSVPALSALLTNKELASWARIALEAIPDPAVDQALRDALGKVRGRLLVGVINSLGVRRDVKAVDALAPLLNDADADIASAAAMALGRIGGDRAATALAPSLSHSHVAVRSAAARGCILCAERYLAEGRSTDAVRTYDLVRHADLPQQRIFEATRGAIVARGADGVPLLAEQLKSGNKGRFALGLRVARELPGPKVTELLVAELHSAAAERQVLLILALADRGDSSTTPEVLEAAKNGPNNVRIAAIRVLQRQGGVSCVPTLLDASLDADVKLSQAAMTALAGLPGSEIDVDVVARLRKAKGKARMVLIELAGQRRTATARAALLEAVEDTDAQVRAVALAALGSVTDLSDLPVLIRCVVKPRDTQDAKAAEGALRVACLRMPEREACADKVAAALPEADVAAKYRLLGALGAMGGDKALRTIAAASKESAPEIQDVTSRAMGEWMTVDAAPYLLDMARSAGDIKYKVRALRGYIRIARQFKLSAETRLAMFRAAMEIAQRNEEKQLSLDILSRIPSAATLQLAVSYLGDPAMKDAAAEAAVKIASQVVGQEPKIVTRAMRKVVEAGVGGNAGNRAKKLLEQVKSGSNLR